MSITLDGPKVETTLKPVVMPTLELRMHLLNEVLTHFGEDANNIRIALEGFRDGVINGVSIKGIDHTGYVQDEARLWFDEIATERRHSLDTLGGKRSVTESLSRSLAHAIMFSVNRFKARGLARYYYYYFPPHVNANRAQADAVRARFGLTAGGSSHSYAPGYAPRRLVHVSPGCDRGTHFAHDTAHPTTR